MNAREAKNTANMATQAAVEITQNLKDVYTALQQTRQNGMAVEKLWREGNRSKLIQIGMALIVFPEPTPLSETIGSSLVVAGFIQKAIKNRSIYMEDIPKSLTSAFREIYNQRANLKL